MFGVIVPTLVTQQIVGDKDSSGGHSSGGHTSSYNGGAYTESNQKLLLMVPKYQNKENMTLDKNLNIDKKHQIKTVSTIYLT